MKIRCPICRKQMEIATIGDLPTFPFCGERCKLIDLGRWIDGDYALSEPAPMETDEEDEE